MSTDPRDVDPDVDRDASTAKLSRRLGDFQLLDKIGQGGMGEVYHARQVSLDRDVAIKLLPQSFAKKGQFLERFKREARAAANLLHPNVLQVYAYGVEEGKAYIAMEFVEGDDLNDRMKQGQVGMDESVRIIHDAALALASAGDKGIVHRDIKPSNIMIRNDGVVKVMDFGLAKAASDAEEGLTEAGLVVGTPKYISPEQGKGAKLDPRSDIYSLGVTFYEMLTSQTPFSADSSTSLIYKHVFEAPPTPRSLNPEIPPFLEDVVLRMLAKKPDERYTSGHEVARDLEEFQQHKDDYIASGRRRVVAEVEAAEEEVVAPVLVAGRASPATLVLALAALVTALISMVVSLRAPRAAQPEGPPRVVVTPEESQGEEVAFQLDLELPKGASASWNAEGAHSRLEMGREYKVRSGRVTILFQRPGYDPIIAEVLITREGATLRNKKPLGTVDLRFQPSAALLQAYKEGREALDAKNYDEAVRWLEKAAARDPEFRGADDQPSVQELLKRAIEQRDKEISLYRKLKSADRMHTARRHRPALGLLKTLPASFAKVRQAQLRSRCLRVIARADEDLELALALVTRGKTGPAWSRVTKVVSRDPEHPKLNRVRDFVRAARRSHELALEETGDPRRAIERVEDYLWRYGKQDQAMRARLPKLRSLAQQRDQRRQLLDVARTRLRLVKSQGAWEEVKVTAERITQLDPQDRSARADVREAERRLARQRIRQALSKLDRACERLELLRGKLAHQEPLLQLLHPKERAPLIAQLRAFLAVGRIVRSERSGARITLKGKSKASVRYHWWVELELRNVRHPIRHRLRQQVEVHKTPRGWVFSSFKTLKGNR